MYQVIKMYGDWEPWWFLENWQDDIIAELSFECFEDALLVYEAEWQFLKNCLPSYQSRKNLLAAFWDKKEQRWCEECDDYLQQYYSLLLLKDGEELAVTYELPTFESSNDHPTRPSNCAVKY